MILAKFPALKAVIGLIAGIILGKFLSFSPLILGLMAAFFVSLAIIFHFLAEDDEHGVDLLVIGALILIGWLGYTLHVRMMPVNGIHHFLDAPRPLLMTGHIDSKIEFKEKNVSFEVAVEEIDTGGEKYAVQGKVLVWVRGQHFPYAYGDQLQIKGKLRTPEKTDEDFDYPRFLRQKGIYGLVWIGQKHDMKLLAQKRGNFFLNTFVFPVKARLTNAVDLVFTGETAALFKSILLGDRHLLPPLLKKRFAAAGIIHILAISGLHVSLVALIAMLFLQTLFRLLPSRPTGFAYGSTIIVLIYYVLLVGAPPSAVRASIMIILFVAGVWLERRVFALNTVAVAAFLILLFSPQLVFMASFQLSFGAIFSIFYLYPPISRLFPEDVFERPFLRSIVQSAIVSLSAILGVMPISIYLFHQFSFVGIITNLFIIPPMGFIISIGLVAMILSLIYFPISLPFFAVEAILLKFVIEVASFFGKLSFAAIDIAPPPLWTIILYYLFLLIIPQFKKPKRKKRR